MMNKTPNDIYKNRLKPPKAFFEWCFGYMPTYVWKNKERRIVASTRKHSIVIEKRLTKKSRLTFFDRADYFEIILCSSKRIERQVYTVCSRFEEGKQILSYELTNLHLLTDNQHIKIKKSYGDGYAYGIKPVGGMHFNYSLPALYPNNWFERLLKVSELKYLQLKYLEIDMLPFYYRYRDRLEYIQKVGAKGIEREFSNRYIDLRVVTMNWLKKWKVYLRNSEHTFENVRLKQAIEKTGAKFINGIEPYLRASDVVKLPKEISTVKFQNYLIRQKKSFSYYQDYLGLLKDLKQEVTNKRRFPKDLEKAHNEAVDTLNALKREIVRKEFETRYKELSAMEMTISDFTFLIPKSANDLIEEGKALDHCVGQSRYINDHAAGKTTIVFVRRNGDRKKSYFTIEYRENRVIQLQGVKNKEEVHNRLKKAVDVWLKIVNQLKKKGIGEVA